MIFSDECYLRDKCWKYHYTDASCRHNNEYCVKLFKVDYLLSQALIPLQHRGYMPLRLDADGTDREQFNELKNIESNIVEFVEKGTNLFIHSKNCGNGKTQWSIRLLQENVNKIWHTSALECRVLFVSVPQLLTALKNNISQTDEYAEHIKKNISNADLVVFDEIASKAGTSFELEQLLIMINDRIDNGKSNIYTSNVCGVDLLQSVGDRLYSRIANMSVDIELFGRDKRGLNNDTVTVPKLST